MLAAPCPSHSLARIANKWTAMVVIVLGDRRRRFGNLAPRSRDQREGPHRHFAGSERDGLVTRHMYAEVPPR